MTISAPASGSPLPSSWTNAITTAVNALTTPPTGTAFTTTTPAGSGWYLDLGNGRGEFHYESTGTVAATTVVTPDFVVPVGSRPSARTPLAAASGTSTIRLASAMLATDGTWMIYNGHSSATTIVAHGTYPLA